MESRGQVETGAVSPEAPGHVEGVDRGPVACETIKRCTHHCLLLLRTTHVFQEDRWTPQTLPSQPSPS
ncbi:hypothetical protein GCM10010246_38570 [Streptomyces cuspidosporus]|uniref:Transposase n=1 Tax=Streptomyces cuspidosporus TaxID=66882 RepID=A0ABP5TDY5_9ACTN